MRSESTLLHLATEQALTSAVTYRSVSVFGRGPYAHYHWTEKPVMRSSRCGCALEQQPTMMSPLHCFMQPGAPACRNSTASLAQEHRGSSWSRSKKDDSKMRPPIPLTTARSGTRVSRWETGYRARPSLQTPQRTWATTSCGGQYIKDDTNPSIRMTEAQ